MNESPWSAASVPGYIVVDVDDLVPFGSIAWEAVCMGCNSAIWGSSWSPGEASGLSERMESTEITEGVFERFGETNNIPGAPSFFSSGFPSLFVVAPNLPKRPPPAAAVFD